MASSRRHYDREFKLNALRLLETSGRRVRDIEEELGIGSGCLSHWRREMADERAFPGQGQSAGKERIRELERELAIVRQERDILKKAVAIFSRPRE